MIKWKFVKNSQSRAKYIKIFIYIRFLKSKIYALQTALLKEKHTNIYKYIIILYILVEYILRIRRVLEGKIFYIFIYLAFFEDVKSLFPCYSWLFMEFIVYKNTFEIDYWYSIWNCYVCHRFLCWNKQKWIKITNLTFIFQTDIIILYLLKLKTKK